MSEALEELGLKLLLTCIALTWLVVLLRAHVDPKYPNFTLRALISNRAGYPDRVAIQELGSWIAFTLVLFVLTVRGLLTEWFVSVYVITFVVRGAYSAALKAKAPPEPEGTTTTSTTTSKTVEGPK